MKSVGFRAELGINEGFDAQKNQNISIRISELCKQLQQLQKDVEEQTGIYIATIVSGPNRSIYKTEWDCPVGGEISYTIHAISDRRTDSKLQLKKDSWSDIEWMRAALILAEKIRTGFGQEYMAVEFMNRHGFSSYILNSERDLTTNLRELELEEEN